MYISKNCEWTPYGTDPELDAIVDHKSDYIRRGAASHSYGLDKLVYDENPFIRSMVASKGYGLDILINDPDWYVRAMVVSQGYGLDKLIDDPDSRVGNAVKEYLKQFSVTLDEWKEYHPTKCARNQKGILQ